MKIIRFLVFLLLASCTMVAPTPTAAPPPVSTPTETAFASAIPPTSPPPPLFYLEYHPEYRIKDGSVSVPDYICEKLYIRYKVTQYEISTEDDVERRARCGVAARNAQTVNDLVDIINNGVE